MKNLSGLSIRKNKLISVPFFKVIFRAKLKCFSQPVLLIFLSFRVDSVGMKFGLALNFSCQCFGRRCIFVILLGASRYLAQRTFDSLFINCWPEISFTSLSPAVKKVRAHPQLSDTKTTITRQGSRTKQEKLLQELKTKRNKRNMTSLIAS